MGPPSLHQNFISFIAKKSEQNTRKEPSQLKPVRVIQKFCCSKCRFSSKDYVQFKRHVAQHEEMTFSCSYCSHVSYTKVESQRHCVQHTGSFPFKCQFCTYGAVRRDYIVKHIQRVHNKDAFLNTSQVESDVLPSLKMAHTHQQGVTISVDATSKIPCTVGQPKGSSLYGHPSAVNASFVGPNGATPSNVTTAPSEIPNTVRQQVPSNQSLSVSNTVGLFHDNSSPVTVKTRTQSTSQFIGTAPHVTPTTVMYPSNSVSSAVSPTISKAIDSMRLCRIQNIPSKTLPKMKVGVLSDNTTCKKAPQILLEGPTDRILQSKIFHRFQMAPPAEKSTPSRTQLKPITVPPESQARIPVSQLTKTMDQPNTSPDVLLLAQPLERATQPSTTPKVHVELLEPINQPIQHNKPLTVSCPEEITIPAGCLVELVEVKTVNGTRELELRLVPQQPDGSTLEDLKDNGRKDLTQKGALGKTSFTCKIAGDNKKPKRFTQDMKSTPHTKAAPGSCEASSEISLAEENGRVFRLKTIHSPSAEDRNKTSQAMAKQVSNSSHLRNVSLSVKGNTSSLSVALDSGRLRCFPLIAGKQDMMSTKSSSQTYQPLSTQMSSKEIFKTVNCKECGCIPTLKSPGQASQDNPDKTFQGRASSPSGLPIISSVFSLCPEQEGDKRFFRHKMEPQYNVTLQKNKPFEPIHQVTVENDQPVGIQSQNVSNMTSDLERLRDSVENTENSVQSHEVKVEEQTERTDGVWAFRPENIIKREDQKGESKPPQETGRTNILSALSEHILQERIPNHPDTVKDINIPNLSDPSSISHQSLSATESISSSRGDFSQDLDKSKLEASNILTKQGDSQCAPSMYPKVILIRIPNLEVQPFQATSAKISSENMLPEEHLMARPVLSCKSNKQNLSNPQSLSQDTVLQLTLKRKQPETENKVSPPKSEASDTLSITAQDDAPPLPKKMRKEKRRKKSHHKTSKVVILTHKIKTEGRAGQMCLMPLKEDQLIKMPGPYQPVVVLNHPKPPAQKVSVGCQTLKDYKWIASVHSQHSQDFCSDPSEAVRICPSLKMRLKKVQGQSYQVIELVLKGITERLIL